MLFLNFKRLMYYLLAPSSRKLPDGNLMLRTKWWQYLIAPLDFLMVKFHAFRLKSIVRSNVTSQKILIEWYLQKYVDANIKLFAYLDYGVFISHSDAIVKKSVAIGDKKGVLFSTSYMEFKDFQVYMPNYLSDRQKEYVKIILKQYLFPNVKM